MLDINRAKFGPAFKGNTKFVQGYLDTLKKCDSEDWDEPLLLELKAKLEAGNGKVTITGTDGNTYELTKDMISVVPRTEKISGKIIEPRTTNRSFRLRTLLRSSFKKFILFFTFS